MKSASVGKMALLELVLVVFMAGVVFYDGSHGSAAIVFPGGPEGGKQFAQKWLIEMSHTAPGFFRGINMQGFAVTNGCEFFVAEPNDVVKGRLLAAARPVCWRYYFTAGTNAGAVDIAAEKGGKFSMQEMACLNPALFEAFSAARNISQVQKQDYQLRFLDIAPIGFSAIWLHAKADDILIPLPPCGWSQMKAYQPYSEREVTEFLQSVAKNPPGKGNL